MGFDHLEAAVSGRVVARDCDGHEIKVGDSVRWSHGEGPTRTVERIGFSNVYGRVAVYLSGSMSMTPEKMRVLVPTPQADEGEVRGWSRNRVHPWPEYDPHHDEFVYWVVCWVTASDGSTTKLVEWYRESGKLRALRGKRDLTLREVVDILAPETKDVPGPAGAADAHGAERPAAAGAVTCAECKVTCALFQYSSRCAYCFHRLVRLPNTCESGPGIAVAPVEDVEGDDAQWASATWES